MQRLLSQRQTSTRHVMAKVLLGFGPNLHWITYASFMIVIVLFAGVIAGTIAISGAGSAKDGIAAVLMGLLFGIVGAPLLMLVTQWQMLQQSQREQALVLLLPGMPRGAALNRALAAQWLWRFGLTWLVASAALWGAIQFTNDSPAGMGLLIPCMAACLIHVRDWSTVRFTQNKLLGLSMFAYFLAGMACVWALFKFELSPWPFMVLALVPTLLALRWKWNRLAGYQQALPAGRWG
jgi:hypothetical protein